MGLVIDYKYGGLWFNYDNCSYSAVFKVLPINIVVFEDRKSSQAITTTLI